MKVYILSYNALPDRAEEHRKQKALAHKLLGYAVKVNYGLNLDELLIKKGSRGKPYFPDVPVKFNKSHTDGMVAVAVGDREVGVDCQKIKDIHRALIKRNGSEREQSFILSHPDTNAAFALVWARKEALMKMKGLGLTSSIRDIDSFIVKNYILKENHAIAAVAENGEDAEFVFLSEKDIQGE